MVVDLTKVIDVRKASELMQAREFRKSEFYDVVTQGDPDLRSFVAGSGTKTDMLYQSVLTDSDPHLATASTATYTADDIAEKRDIVYKFPVSNKWSAYQLARNVSEGDPMGGMLQQTGAYWRRAFSKYAIATIRGILKANGTDSTEQGNMLHDIAGTSFVTGTTNFNIPALIAARGTRGDQATRFRSMITHSAVANRGRGLNQITDIRPSDNDLVYTSCVGMSVVEDDFTPSGTSAVRKTGANGAAGVYNTLLAEPGFIRMEVTEPFDRPAMAFSENEDTGTGWGSITLHQRYVIGIWVPGFSFTGTPAGVAPTLAELADGDNWTHTYDNRKQIGLASLVSREHS